MILPNIGTGCVDIWEQTTEAFLLLGHSAGTDVIVSVPLRNTGSFSKVVLSQGAVKQVFLGVFLMFLAFFYSKIWAQFHFGTLKPYK